MDTDILFALAVLREEYKSRRRVLVEEEMPPRRRDNVLCDLETISRAIGKMENRFTPKPILE